VSNKGGIVMPNYNNPFNYNNPYNYGIPNYPVRGIVPPMSPMNTYAFVNGIEGAKSYLMQPNQSVLLMDSDELKCYMKQSDSTGKATIRTFKLEEITEKEESKIPVGDYVSKSDIDTYYEMSIKFLNDKDFGKGKAFKYYLLVKENNR
jgi:hypothetical protein